MCSFPADRRARGQRGEEETCRRLLRAGFAVLARNWRCPGGELDVVAARGDILAFVEVKTRAAGALTGPLDAVDARKRARVVRAAQCFLLGQPALQELQPRFDVAAVLLGKGGAVCRFDYYSGAFTLDDL